MPEDYLLRMAIVIALMSAFWMLVGVLIFLRAVKRKSAREVQQVRTEFVSLVSHQLRTPLTGVEWQLEALLSEARLTKVQKDSVHEVITRVRGMSDLVRDLLDVSRLEAGHKNLEIVRVSMRAIVEDVLKEITASIKEQHCEVHVDAPAGVLEVNTDPNMLRQIIFNFLTNAIRYSRPDHRVVTVQVKTVGQRMRVSVEDNGIGIPLDVQDRIFQKGFRADNAVKATVDGTGLGLYLAKLIIQALGGTIGFTTTEGVGSTFWFELPA